MQYLPLPRLCQKLSSRTTPIYLNWEQIVFELKSRILWIWSCPVTTKELFLEIAAPKRQVKFLKITCEVVSFY